MKNIAVLLTCFNRKVKTIDCLDHLYKAVSLSDNKINVDIYLTDAGHDGTGDTALAMYPKVNILKVNKDLFWTGGMRNSWTEALKGSYDGFLLLNDDTNVRGNLFNELFDTHKFCIENYTTPGVYIGSTLDKVTGKLTYGGARMINKLLNTYRILEPNGSPQDCDLGNGNIMLVTACTVERIGILSDKYVHGIADYDYTLTAKRKEIPVLITANYCGECSRDHADKYSHFKNMNISQRITYLNSPLGFAFPDQLRYMKRNFPYRLPFVFTAGWFKVLFPGIYVLINKLR